MKEDLYSNYKADRYIHYRLVPTGEIQIKPTKRNGKIIHVRKPILEKRILEFEEIKAINLDNNGIDVRTSGEDFTLIHNYLFDFWGAILGSEAVALYTHLKRYCYGKKDYCFPNMDEIVFKMKKSRNTVNKYLDILEMYGFILKLYRMDRERHNGESSPFYKIRRYIPLLSKELIEDLPDLLRRRHDEFLAECNGIELKENISSESIIAGLMVNARVMKTKSQKSKDEKLKIEGLHREYLLTKMSLQEQSIWADFLQEIEKKISKPSLDTWIRPSLIFKQQSVIHIVCQNEFTLDWLKDKYYVMSIEILSRIINEDTSDLTIEYFTYENYLKINENKKM
ncbi:DnaA N-terminal domain-containing protein [Bacillus sp. SM2101]|uniref:DnaA N-terminal domain-containing protein n=1 Tax=Bacillus sp. SM2101 TaxID=2805366 RepID=UPI001BDE8808|nr:DnaA N-terminal domain-containing protein [Bacillus sp. SM2101]